MALKLSTMSSPRLKAADGSEKANASTPVALGMLDAFVCRLIK